MNKFKGRIEITIICMIIGIMLIMQMKSIDDLGGLVTTHRADQLLIELNQIKENNDDLQTRINELEDQLSSFESQAADNNKYVEKLLNDVNNAEKISGLTDLKGPGLIITLDYNDIEEDNFNPFEYNSSLLLLLVNELNSAGAEAISINDERVINTTEIRLAGSHININGKKNSYPYIFKVIGDSETLKSAINLRNGIVDVMEQSYINVSIKQSDSVLITKYNGLINYKYAQSVDQQ